jgi:hypothetical protein
MRHSARFTSLLRLVIAAAIAAGIGGCGPGPNVWPGVKNPAPVPAQPKEAAR